MKKWKKYVLIGGAAAAAYAAFIGGMFTFSYIQKQQYNERVEKSISSEEQVKTLLGATKADSGFLSNFNERLLPNGDDPVYVSFDDNFYKEELKPMLDVSIKVLDTFFDIVHDINDKYTYEIIPQSEALKKSKTTATINFYYKPIEGAMAQVKQYGYEAKKSVTIDSKYFTAENLNPTSFKSDYYLTRVAMLERALVHEMDHIFTIYDIYDIDYAHADTAVDVRYRDLYDSACVMPTPNDYACILSMYTPSLSKLELANFIEEIPNKLDAYKQKYYDTASKILKERSDLNCSYPTNFKSSTFNVMSSNCYNYVSVEVDDKRYRAELYDVHKNFISSCEGDVYKTKYHIFLDNMYFPYGLYNEKATAAFYVKPHYQSMGITNFKKKYYNFVQGDKGYKYEYYKQEGLCLVDTAGWLDCYSKDTKIYTIDKKEYESSLEENQMQ